MKVRRLVVLSAAAFVLGALSSAHAAPIIINTAMGQGADAEVREEGQNPIFDNNQFISILRGLNRGTQAELATQVNNTTTTATGDTSRIMFMKFDVTSLPGAADPFWNNKRVKLRIHVDASNLSGSRLLAIKPGGNAASPTNLPSDFRLMKFKISGLEPGHVYSDDGGDPNRMDDFGNTYDSQQYKYNWSEGTNTAAGNMPDGITYYDAPGLTPHCISSDLGCSITESIGKIDDDFNSDTRYLGTYSWPKVAPRNHLPVGLPIDVTAASIKQLVLDAKAAGRSTVTLMISHGLDPQNNSAALGISENSATGFASPERLTPASFLGFNDIAISKNRGTLLDDPSYDPDGGLSPNGPLPPTGSPYSCDGTAPNPNSPNCPGHLLGQNNAANGFPFAPKLMIVPEPTSMLLLALGTLAVSVLGRRRK